MRNASRRAWPCGSPSRRHYSRRRVQQRREETIWRGKYWLSQFLLYPPSLSNFPGCHEQFRIGNAPWFTCRKANLFTLESTLRIYITYSWCWRFSRNMRTKSRRKHASSKVLLQSVKCTTWDTDTGADLDLIEMAFQAREYEKRYLPTAAIPNSDTLREEPIADLDLQPFFNSSIPRLRNAEVKEWGQP